MSKEVYMFAKVRLEKPVKIDNILAIDFGGYEFVVNGLPIKFDFDGYGTNIIEDGQYQYIEMNTDEEHMCKIADIDEWHDEYYAELGIEREKITAEFLATATEIKEFYFEITTKAPTISGEVSASAAVLTDVSFRNENGEEFFVDKKLLNVPIMVINK